MGERGEGVDEEVCEEMMWVGSWQGKDVVEDVTPICQPGRCWSTDSNPSWLRSPAEHSGGMMGDDAFMTAWRIELSA